MYAFFWAVVAWLAMLAATWVLYLFVDRLALKARSDEERRAREVTEQSDIWTLITVVYGAFVGFVDSVVSVVFAVQAVHGTWNAALFYLVVVIPLCVICSVLLYVLFKAAYMLLVR